MVMEALRGYVQLASGLTEVTRERARNAARALVAQAGHFGDQPGDARTQVRALADDLATTARANRDLLLGMVRAETERAVASLGLVTADDLAALTRRIDAVEQRLAREQSGAHAEPGDVPAPKMPAKKTAKVAAKKTAAVKSAAKKSSAIKAAARPSAAPEMSTSETSASEPSASHPPAALDLTAVEHDTHGPPDAAATSR